MDCINFNKILDRENIAENICNILRNFEENKKDLLEKRGIYIYGESGIGKTTFVNNILKKMNYDIIYYDAGDIRNKNIIETITKNNISDKSVLSLFKKKRQSIAIIMDEIDGMNNGDKGGITALIKLIRPKKTKKQKLENITNVPIICISNYHIDKKIKEMIKICETIELKTPTKNEIKNIITILMPKLEDELREKMTVFMQGDLRKLKSTFDIYKNQESILKNQLIQNMFQKKNYNEDVKDIIKKLLNNKYELNKHTELMNETDRTSVGLLYHENIIDVLKICDKKKAISFYSNILDNICFSDYIDRITFQKQIWIFNEMSSLIKTFYNHDIYHEHYKNNKQKYNPVEVRFTKVLTKYSTEYNNSLFIIKLCQELNMDIKDMISYFMNLKKTMTIDEINELFNNENYDINKLDINRIYRYIQSFC